MTPSAKHNPALLQWIWHELRDYRRTWAAGMALLAVSRLAGAAAAFATKFLVDGALARHSSRLLHIAVWISLGVLVQAAASFALTWMIGKRSQRMLARVRARVFAHVLRLPLGTHDHASSGSLASRIFYDSEALRHALGFPLMDFAGAAITCAAAGAALVYLDWQLAAIAAGFAAVAAAAYCGCAMASRKIADARAALAASASGFLTESAGAIRAVKAFAAEQREQRRFAARLQEIVANADRSTRLSAGITATHLALSGGAVVLLLLVGAQQIAAGRLSTGGLMTSVVLCGMGVAALVQASKATAQLAESLAGAERIRALLASPSEDSGQERTVVVERLRGVLEFENVSFAYVPGVPVLDGISFHAAPGAVVAIVGASGAGKSTLANLAAAFYQPVSGRILIDGMDLRQVNLASYRHFLGLVPQDPCLMSGSIAENVALGNPAASMDSIRAACQLAYVDEFAERLPLGYDTQIGERGVQLSGGQRQRIAIARALLINPQILILDEPTSTLDDQADRMVQAALKAAMRGRTTLLITHRESDLRHADQVLALGNGRLAAAKSQWEVHAT